MESEKSEAGNEPTDSSQLVMNTEIKNPFFNSKLGFSLEEDDDEEPVDNSQE